MPDLTELNYEQRLDWYRQEERRIQSPEGSARRAEIAAERIRLGVDALRGRITQQEAGDAIAALDAEWRLLEICGDAVKRAVDEVRAEKAAYMASEQGNADRERFDAELRTPTQADLARERADRIRAEHAAKQVADKAAQERYEREVAAERLRHWHEDPVTQDQLERARIAHGHATPR